MGIDGQANILYKSKPVSLADACYVISEIHRSNIEKAITESGKTAAAIDASLLAYQNLEKSCGPVGAVVCTAQELSRAGIDVLVIFVLESMLVPRESRERIK
jgi:hypothetical protein